MRPHTDVHTPRGEAQISVGGEQQKRGDVVWWPFVEGALGIGDVVAMLARLALCGCLARGRYVGEVSIVWLSGTW